MAYLTQAQLVERIGPTEVLQLSDRNAARQIDEGVIAAALDDADAEANGYLGVRYNLPLLVVPDTVKQLVAVIARYNLFRRNVPDTHPVYIAYLRAVATLREIAAGTVVLPLSVGTAEIPQAGLIYATTPSLGFDTTGLLD